MFCEGQAGQGQKPLFPVQVWKNHETFDVNNSFWTATQMNEHWHIQRLAKVNAPGCVNAAGKLDRSDELQQ